MLSYKSVYNAPVDQLKAAVDKWNEMVGKLKGLGPDLRSDVKAPLSGWAGKDATAARTFMDKAGKEFDDVVKEATGVRDLLNETQTRLREARDEIRRLGDQEIPSKGLKIDDEGKVVSLHPSRFAPGASINEELKKSKQLAAAYQLRVDRLRVKATEVDKTAAWELHVSLNGKNGDFTGLKHNGLGAAWKAGSENNFAALQNFMFNEMKGNLNTKEFAELRKLFASDNPFDRAKGYKMWYDLVHNNSVWDHKEELQKMLGIDTKSELYQKIPGQNKQAFYDIWSNLHYGYVGAGAGIPPDRLEQGATLDKQIPGAEKFVGKSDVGDEITVRKGIELYQKYGPNMTQQQFQSEVNKMLQDMERRGAPQIKPG
ncbi:putative RNase toxin 44 of polymorphic toxin system [Herbihabitans rhizosphaerae]|uniref:Putative RNase toxin 44 of polymorphic toxin system n=1 Tax=Herbihabitans rhizosphaerae TaxID=1872711 RepID=A0A4Q7KIL7_9PSEU|nr:polymorphic toxin type 44 domain-containing protein [Herbihabitans rhizosphaerae]RZS34055.1 putative RNase toxin 44 of polymorphic toxin system [Herbihabitans rhizosphaerae]